MFVASPAAADDKDVQLSKCESSMGTVAITEGDQQGWNQFKLASPRGMLGTLIEQSGCFTLHNPASGAPADYLMSAIAGSKEDIDQSMNIAKGALTEGLVRSGAAGQLLTKVPMGGALFRAFGGLGGKKKTILAGLRIMSPGTGQTLISGTGETKKSFIKIIDTGGWGGAATGEDMGGYASSSDGKMLTGAFIQAYNGLVAQRSMLATVRPARAAAAAAPAGYTVAVDTKLWAAPAATGAPLRALRTATTLTPTGAPRQGIFVQVTDGYGTKGWVSVEDLR
ncbi:SH3 domain-containing protein [Sphingomonas sp. M1-B02]|uniref:SH3 domain-containing protein n=1 Tax=Sphingomonas sp. M1-B02 TaxID=3114300 RepID=UPI00223FB3A8|nr:SH3 domain-containing protein [Sphingomonas sp. S6-11]UZK67915.1 SH3 domain-containing protein [Sphingomonas sp. S6-11]